MNVLFVSSSNFGSIYPQLGIAHQLKSPNVSIGFLTDSHLGPLIQEEGFAFYGVHTETDYFNIRVWAEEENISGQFKLIESVHPKFSFDLIITNDLCLGPYAFRLVSPIRIFTLGFGTWLYTVKGSEHPETETREWRVKSMQEHFEKACDSIGLELKGSSSFFPTEDAYFLRTVPELEPESDLLPKNVYFIGPQLWEPENKLSDSLRDFLETDQDVVYIQAGRVFDSGTFLQNLLLALSQRNYKILLDTHRSDEEQIHHSEDIFQAPHIPMSACLPRCKLIISTGMSTPYLFAATTNTPHIVISSGGSGVSEVADRILKAGLGIYMDIKKATPANILKAISYVNNNKVFEDSLQKIQSALTTACDMPSLIRDRFEER